MYSKEVPWGGSPPLAIGLRQPVAVLLHGASRLLAVWARKLASRKPGVDLAVQLEFYAEAGAPEGALYVNGQLVGRMSGVNRL
jgi:hypothetical protein